MIIFNKFKIKTSILKIHFKNTTSKTQICNFKYNKLQKYFNIILLLKSHKNRVKEDKKLENEIFESIKKLKNKLFYIDCEQIGLEN